MKTNLVAVVFVLAVVLTPAWDGVLPVSADYPDYLDPARPAPPSGRPQLIMPFQSVDGTNPQVIGGYGESGSHQDEYWHEYYAVDYGLGGRSFPVVAVANGTLTRHDEPGYSGGTAITVFIDHGNGWKTKYAHLNDVTVRGTTIQNGGSVSVTQGETIGRSGNTGTSAIHLHFELRAQYRPNEYQYTGSNTWSYPVPEIPTCPSGQYRADYYNDRSLALGLTSTLTTA
jgi:murein DD-endopeptidase MepM/ murein hydrolase activator NlpD